jgi:APA family basic amino acid/polyamine antiporter
MSAGEAGSRRELLRVLGIIFGLAAVVGGCIGQGILRAPGLVAAAVPSPGLILLLWVIGGLFAALAALAYVELATAIPCAGGPYVFARRGLGPATGVTVGWSDWLNNLSAQGFLTVVLAEFLHRLGLFSAVPVGVLAPMAVAVFFVVNWTSTRICGSSQVIGSALKGVGLLLLIIVLLTVGVGSATPAPAESHGAVVIGVAGVIVALRLIQNTYNGWNNCTYFCEEMQSPERSVPRAMFGGIALVTALYLLVNVAMLRVLTPAEMAGSTLAAGDALRAAIGGWADVALTIFGILSVGALTNLQMMFCSRIALAMARDRVLPSALAHVARGGTPRNGLIATALLAGIFAASGTYEQLAAFSVALGLLTDMIVCISAIRLRSAEPELRRPWRAPLYPWSLSAAALLQAAFLAALVWEDPIHSLAGTSVAVAIGLAYALKTTLGPRPAAAPVA